MPLKHSKSAKAFSHNVAAERHAGHPLKQALAIAYSVKRKAHKARGGQVAPDHEDMSRGHDEIHHKSEAGNHDQHPGKGHAPHLAKSRLPLHDLEHDDMSKFHDHEAVESIHPDAKRPSEHGHGMPSHLKKHHAKLAARPMAESEHFAHGGMAHAIHKRMRHMAEGGELHGIDQDPEHDYSDEDDMEDSVPDQDDFLTAEHGGHDGEEGGHDMEEFLKEESHEHDESGHLQHPHLAKILEGVRKRHYGRK